MPAEWRVLGATEATFFPLEDHQHEAFAGGAQTQTAGLRVNTEATFFPFEDHSQHEAFASGAQSQTAGLRVTPEATFAPFEDHSQHEAIAGQTQTEKLAEGRGPLMAQTAKLAGGRDHRPPTGVRERRHHESGMETGHWVLHHPHEIASFNAAVTPDSVPAVMDSADRHIDGVTCSYTTLRTGLPPLRYIQLELVRPAAGLRSYSLRQLQIIGPRLAEPFLPRPDAPLRMLGARSN